MRNIFVNLLLCMLFIFTTTIEVVVAQGVRISADNLDPDNSAMLDVVSTNKGMLVPRMTSAQRAAIASPATGLLVFQSDGASGFYYFNGSAWVSLSQPGGTAGGDLTGTYPNPTINTSAVTSAKIADLTIVNNDIGAAAGISGTKISPNFGTQNIITNGRSAVGTNTIGANNRLVINDGHLRSAQTTEPSIVVNTPTYAGAASIISPSTDVAGKLSFTMTAPGGCGGCAIVSVTFNQTYNSNPIVIITPANVWASLRWKEWEMYVNSSSTGFTIHSNQFPTVTTNAMQFNYFVIETQ